MLKARRTAQYISGRGAQAVRYAPRAMTVLTLAAATTLSGCSMFDGWFGEAERKLEGDRIALRTAVESEGAAGGVATFGAARNIGDWPQAGGAPNRSVGHVNGKIALQRVWSTSIGAGSDSESRIVSAPVAAGGRIFALDAAAQVTAVSEKDGARLWQTDLTPEDEDGRDGFGGGLAVSGEYVVATTGFGEALGLNAGTGEIAWRVQLGAPLRAAPNVAGGVAVAVTRDGDVVAFKASSGEEVWRVIGVQGGASMLSGGGSSPAISGEIVAAPFASGDVGVFRMKDGAQGWSQSLGLARRGSAMSMIADVSSPPVITGGRVIAGGVSGRLASFEIPTGRRMWARDLGAYNPVWASGGTLFVLSEDARVLALSAKSGETIWETALPRYDNPERRKGAFAYGGPILIGGKLYVVSSDEKILQIDAATGKLEAEQSLPGPSTIPPIALNGRLIVLDDDGELHALQ